MFAYNIKAISKDKNKVDFSTKALSEEEAGKNFYKFLLDQGWEHYCYKILETNLIKD